ncbi:MAG: hypothetical protein J6386_13895 [Candidatus Synoicihabitans palmerolidicus]|nr:hypothetical protein [Candidatus Synoicihabitans palmerolidicus]
MLADRLDTVPFPFIGASVPEGHQGQSVEGMSHGSVMAKLKNGFHHHRIAWSFNADHQPIGGKFDAREDALVRGSLLASYITFDLSPELALAGAFSPDTTERDAARSFITANFDGSPTAEELFATPSACREAIEALEPHPDRVFFF